MVRWLVCVLLVAAVGCGSDSAPENSFELVPAGKADDYFSNVSVEYQFSGKISVPLTAAEASDPKVVQERATGRVTAVGVFLTAYLTEKFRGEDVNNDGKITEDEVFFSNDKYGGFQAMVRNRSVASSVVELVDGTYYTSFTIDAAGPKGLLEALARNGGRRDAQGRVEFDLKMIQGATGMDSAQVSSFDPSTYTGALETVTLAGDVLPQAGNAYPQYTAFFEDNVFDMTLFYGYDYNVPREDLIEAREAFETLQAMGFVAPVAKFEDLTAESGPFVKTIQTWRPSLEGCADREVLAWLNDRLTTAQNLAAAGIRPATAEALLVARNGVDRKVQTVDDLRFETMAQVDAVEGVGSATLDDLRAAVQGNCRRKKAPVRVEVRLFYADMFKDAAAAHRQKVFDEFVHRDVFFYNGHAGPYYGFYLDQKDEAYIAETEFAGLPFSKSRQQLFVAQGCQTYSQYADMLYANPNRSVDNTDVITTVNYSYGAGTMFLVEELTWEVDGLHAAPTYKDLIAGLNRDVTNKAGAVFYGVVGIDGNPRVHPYADVARAGRACSSSAECGATEDAAICLEFNDGSDACVVRTLSAEGCSAGQEYAYLGRDAELIGGICY